MERRHWRGNARILWAGSAEEMSVQWWQDIYDTNLFGLVRCMRLHCPFSERGAAAAS